MMTKRQFLPRAKGDIVGFKVTGFWRFQQAGMATWIATQNMMTL
jgi:hypothetical protein